MYTVYFKGPGNQPRTESFWSEKNALTYAKRVGGSLTPSEPDPPPKKKRTRKLIAKEDRTPLDAGIPPEIKAQAVKAKKAKIAKEEPLR